MSSQWRDYDGVKVTPSFFEKLQKIHSISSHLSTPESAVDLSSQWQIITDFDHTMTHPSGDQCHGSLREYAPTAEMKDAFAAVYDRSKRPKDAPKYYTWLHFNKVMKEFGHEWMFEHCLDKSNMRLRSHCRSFIEFTASQSIPMLIVSAGIHNIIELFLDKKQHALFDNLSIIGNRFFFHKQSSQLSGIGPLLYSHNKMDTYALCRNYFHSIQRPFILCLGDRTYDTECIANIPNIECVVSIGFCNPHTYEPLSELEKSYDVVITTPNAGFSSIYNILKMLLTAPHTTIPSVLTNPTPLFTYNPFLPTIQSMTQSEEWSTNNGIHFNSDLPQKLIRIERRTAAMLRDSSTHNHRSQLWQILSDFDLTISESGSDQGHHILAHHTPISPFRDLVIPFFDEDTRDQSKPLAWFFSQFHTYMKQYRFEEWMFDEVLSKAKINPRDDVSQLWAITAAFNIPLLLVSAGIRNIIQRLLKEWDLIQNNVTIVANDFTFNTDGLIDEIGPLLYSHNKADTYELRKSYFDSADVKNRPFVLCLGDSLTDVDCVSNIPHISECLKVGFLSNNIDTKLKSYLDTYDIVITQPNASMQFVCQLLSTLINDCEAANQTFLSNDDSSFNISSVSLDSDCKSNDA